MEDEVGIFGPFTYQMEMESNETVGSERNPEMSTSPWLYQISKLYIQAYNDHQVICVSNIGMSTGWSSYRQRSLDPTLYSRIH